ncbi:MAG: GNAT family N-acetyltransferase, partial [Candidatus Heimdallarchaeota archaeon]
EYHEFNRRGEKLYPKLGFKQTGVRREAHFVNGKYHDSIVMDLLRDEFNSKYPALNLERK